jgi:hypothetical protein
MSQPSNRRPILTPHAIKQLHQVRQQILDAAASKLPERLVMVTAATAVRLARGEEVAAESMSERVIELARETLNQLAQQPWKPDTVLLLRKQSGEGRHGIRQ